jgi:hypothetical protein
MWAAVLNAERGVSNVVFLTRLGGGAFGNDDDWIHLAIRNALQHGAGYRAGCEARELRSAHRGGCPLGQRI